MSVNYAHVNSSIYIIEKAIHRKVVDEVYMFLSLSLDLVKNIAIKNK